VRSLLVAVVSGVALGVGSLLAVDLLPHPLNLIGTLGGPWLSVAFAVGSLGRSRAIGALAGLLAMASAVAAYYLTRDVTNASAPGGVTVGGEAINYLVIGLLAGMAMGFLGAAWRRDRSRWRAGAPGLLAGALGAEVIVLVVRSWTGLELVYAVVQGGAAVALALLLPGHALGGVAALVIAVASAVVVGGLILAVDLPLRLFG
jgi:hypothetical protein